MPSITPPKMMALKHAGQAPGGVANGVHPKEPPPALDQSWRDSHANKSMGVLIERLAQKCFTDLNETVTKMSELPLPSSAQANGISLHATDVSPDSVARKRMWMEFAQNQRDRFIKTLVLADWSRSEHDMAKLIDLRVWEDKQRNAQSNAISFIGTIKHDLMSAKMPNPNIEGALELLATSKASQIRDLGYLPPKRLTANQLLRTLQDMNVTLATRLNLHEQLPPHFHDYTISDGRATFRVAQEFDVDLSVADQDPASPFYFIDIRFLFSPTSPILNEQLRAALEVRCNAAMAEKGLQGCYDFLHNFVLTHKINILHSQTNELLQGRWFDCLHLNALRRILTVQYWSSRAGPKSWLEFGIATGKRKGVSSRKPPTPCLVIRWFREGAEVKDDPIEVDWQNIDLEKILSVTIAKHVSWSLRKIHEGLDVLAGGQSKLKAELTTSAEVPERCALTLSLPATRSPLKVVHEPVTGRIILSPPTPLVAQYEALLNRGDPKLDKPLMIANLLCGTVRERVASAADLSGWKPGAAPTRQDNLPELFGKETPQLRALYTENERWGLGLGLMASFSLSGERWWAVRLESPPGSQGVPNGHSITSARLVSLAEPLTATNAISKQYMLRIERLAAMEMMFTALSGQLTTMGIPHRLEKGEALADWPDAVGPASSSTAAVYIQTSALLSASPGPRRPIWATDLVRITYESTDDDSSDMRHCVRLTVKHGQLKHLQDYLAQGHRSDIAVGATGALALRIYVRFGQPFAEKLRTHLHHVERLDRYLGVLKTCQFRCTSVNMSKLAFRYGENPTLAAQLTFPQDLSRPVQLKFEPLGSNPHQRMRPILEKYINGNGSGKDGFTTAIKTLDLTLPLLQSLEQIETKDTNRPSVFVHVRHPLWLNLTYKAPLPPSSWDIRCRSRSINGVEHFVWHLQRSQRPGLPTLPDSIGDALKALYEENGSDWRGTGNAVLAQPASIGEVLERLDSILRKFEGMKIEPPPDELDSKPLIQQTSVEQAPPPQRQKPQAQAQPQAMQRQPSQQRAPQQMQRQPSQQMQRQPSQQQTQQMQRQPSQQQAQQMQRQPSQQQALQMQRQISQQQMLQRQMAQQRQQQLLQNRPPAPNTKSEPIEID